MTVTVADVRPIGALRTVSRAISLVWLSGRALLTWILLSTVVTSAAIAGQLLAGRELLDLLAGSADVDFSDLLPWLMLLGGLLLVASLSQAISSDLRIPLAEHVQRRATTEILDVATAVDLEAFEAPEFHDRLTRARAAAAGQSSAVVFGLVTMLSTLVVAIGIVAVLVTVTPVLVPIAVLGYLPVAFVNVRNNRATYQLESELTELGSRALVPRVHVEQPGGGQGGPCVRHRRHARGWHSELWDRRLRRLADLVRRRLVRTTIASLVTTVALVAALSFALVLAARGTISLGDAGAAIIGLQQLSSRLQAAGAGFSAVHSGVTFLRDFDSFRVCAPGAAGASGTRSSTVAGDAADRRPRRVPLPRCTTRCREGRVVRVATPGRSWRSSAPTARARPR